YGALCLVDPKNTKAPGIAPHERRDRIRRVQSSRGATSAIFRGARHARTTFSRGPRKMLSKEKLLSRTVEHIDITQHNVVPLVDAMRDMAFSARDLAREDDIYDRMLRDSDCGIILCLAGYLVSAGLHKVFVDMERNQMVDAIVSTW